MRTFLLAGGLALMLGVGGASQASAFTRYASGPGDDLSVTSPGRGVGHGPGAWRRHYDRQQYHHYRGNPGAQFQLRQSRRIYCRNTPERC